MDFDKLIEEANSELAALYLHRKNLELQHQSINTQINQTEIASIRISGAIELLEKLKNQGNPDGK